MGDRLSRYSVEIALQKELLDVKGKTHELCCAWGFLWNNSEDPIYNVVGWASLMDAPIKTIAWDENYSITASEKGRRHGAMVDKAMEPKPISTGQQFTVTDFKHTEVKDDSDTVAEDAFGYRTKIKCSIVLDIALDLGESNLADNLTPVFIASVGQDPLDLSMKRGIIVPTRTLLFFFAKRGTMMRRHGLNLQYLENPPIIYNYGKQSTRFTKITLVYEANRPQLWPEVQAKTSESFLLRR